MSEPENFPLLPLIRQAVQFLNQQLEVGEAARSAIEDGTIDQFITRLGRLIDVFVEKSSLTSQLASSISSKSPVRPPSMTPLPPMPSGSIDHVRALVEAAHR